MAKGKKRNRSSNWTANEHVAQEDKKKKTLKQQDRTALLTHNTREKRDATKVQLHRTKIQRALTDLKHRLEQWDPIEEAVKEKKRLLDEELRKKDADDTSGQSNERAKKKGRKGPETWRLKGAARPAWEVYDFDTRYVDPHIAAHTAAAERAKRSQNILALFKGRLLEQTVAPDHLVREYLGILMQFGYLSQESKQYKSAREAWLECMELEGDVSPVSSAREALMRLYIDLKRTEAAFRLGERLESDDSCMIRFSMALTACQLKRDEAKRYVVQAVKSNIFAAYYLGYYDTFVDVMEYTDELQEAEEEPQSSFEEALEYCVSDHAKLWQSTNGAVDMLRNVLRDRCGLDDADLEWSHRLYLIEEKSELSKPSSDVDAGSCDDDEASDVRLDIKMFAGMFRTAMEMCRTT